jgi:nucleoside-diphosphate-sugar epimerase
MRAAIIGAAGFLGTALSECLLDSGWEAFGYDLLASDRLAPGLRFQTFDVLRDELALPRETDAVFYLAQSPRYREFPDAADHLFGVNTYGAIRAAQAACAARVRFFCYTSTGNVYAPSLGPLAESDPVRRDDPYALSKLAAEEALALFGGRMPVLCPRLFGLFGPGQKGMLPVNLLARIRAREEIVLEPAASETGEVEGLCVSFTYVADAARLLERLAQVALAGTRLPGVLNVAGPEPVSIRRFSLELGRAVGIEPKFVRASADRTHNLIADLSRLRALVPAQFTPLAVAIAQTCRGMRRAGGGPELCR